MLHSSRDGAADKRGHGSNTGHWRKKAPSRLVPKMCFLRQVSGLGPDVAREDLEDLALRWRKRGSSINRGSRILCLGWMARSAQNLGLSVSHCCARQVYWCTRASFPSNVSQTRQSNSCGRGYHTVVTAHQHTTPQSTLTGTTGNSKNSSFKQR